MRVFYFCGSLVYSREGYMENALLWSQRDFQEIYVEAVEAYRRFQNSAADVLRESSANTDLTKALQDYDAADKHYKVVIELLARLSIRFTKKTKNRTPAKWTQQEKDDEALVTTLAGMLSRGMNNLLTIHKISLKRAQDARIAAEREAEYAS
jgi:hypothetical protein